MSIENNEPPEIQKFLILGFVFGAAFIAFLT